MARRGKLRDRAEVINEAATEASEDIVRTIAAWVTASWAALTNCVKALGEVVKGTASLEPHFTWLFTGLEWLQPREGYLFILVGVVGTALGWAWRFIRHFFANRREPVQADSPAEHSA